MTSKNNHGDEEIVNDAPELSRPNSAFEVIEKHDAEANDEPNTQINVSNLSSMAPNALFNSFPKEYIETLILRLNERPHDHDMDHVDKTHNTSLSIDRLKNMGGTLAQQIPTLFDQFKREDDNKQNTEVNDDEYQYQYYHTKINHDIEWNTNQNDELFVISKGLFEHHEDTDDDNDDELVTKQKEKLNLNALVEANRKRNTNTKIKRKASTCTNNNKNDEDATKSWTQSLNSMLVHAKHRMYTMLANPSFKWDTRQNRHLFSLSEDVWIMGNHYQFNGNDNKHVMQCIVLEIYSKIWITYRSKFEEILSSQYTSDAGWGCMVRTAQMMTAQSLIIYYFGYKWNLTMLDMNDSSIRIYYECILSLFNDSSDSALSIHKMVSYGSVLYDKPVGHWYGPMQTCIMIKKCIQSYPKLDNDIECVVSDSGVIYKAELINITIHLNKSALIFLPLRLGLDSLNFDYIESIKKCFHLTECIGIIGGKPQKSLYFIGYQGNNLFYLDPHTVFPTPNINKPLSSQRCVFHCQEINSLPANELDPSMAVAFFIKPSQIHLDRFWNSAMAVTHDKYSIFSLSQNRPNWKVNSTEYEHDDEWEKI